jgi:putative phage-type endonuclease
MSESRSIDSLAGPVRLIGGSDAAPACGVEVFGKNRITLWEELTGRRPRQNITSRPIRRGNSLEDWIGSEYALATDSKVRRRLKPITNRKYPWMRAHIDRRVAGSGVILECKSVHPMALFRGEQWGEAGTDEVPMHYLLQCVHYNIVADAERTDLAAMFGDELRVYPILRNAELEARVIELERQVWEHAERDVAPAPMTAAEVRTLYPSDDASAIVATPEIIQICERLSAVKSEYAKAEAEKDHLTDLVQVFMAECAELVDESGKPLATWWKAKDSVRTNWGKAFGELVVRTGAVDLAAEALAQSEEITAGSRRFLLKKRAA